MREPVERVIQRIRPAIQRDGGDVELINVTDGVVRLRLSGSCLSCETTRGALIRGLERAIRAEVPEIERIEIVE